MDVGGPVTDATSGQLRFKEIEHKFVVDDGFDLERFGAVLETLNPTRTTSLQVLDTYYLLRGSRTGRFVIRHRFDEELHHLTVKTLETDTEVRIWDSSSETRFLVLPERPAGTDGWPAERLANLVTRDSMIGVARAAQPDSQ